MMLKYRLLFVGCIFLAKVAVAQIDSTFTGRAMRALDNQLPREKVYLHLDKPRYNFNDTIWYKAYVVVGQHHQLSALSGVLYVELISPNDTLISRQTLKLTSGTAGNGIPLDAALTQGAYHLRAYTRWMRNAGSEYFYHADVSIGGVAATPFAGKQVATVPDIQFFPEGGKLVNGVRSRVGIKAVNARGMGENVKGVIEDNSGNVVADFATQHLGMGAFAFIPQSGKTYKAKIIGYGESAKDIELPTANEQGYTLAVNNNSADSIFIKVAVNDKMLSQKQGSTFYLVAQSAGKVYYIAKAELTQPVYMAKVERSRFPSGIIQFTLFDGQELPIAERIAFIQGNDSLALHVTTQATVSRLGQPVKFNINATAGGRPAVGAFSVAVNLSAAPADEFSESSILNNLLLTSDLKGKIEQPNYYFSNTAQANADLDLLMLTQGYRRFVWKQALAGEPVAPVFQPENLLELNGLVQTMNGKPVLNGKVVLTAPRQNLIADTLTDANGNFKFINLDITDTAKVTLNAKKGNGNNSVQITVANPGYAEILKMPAADTEASALPPQNAKVLQQEYNVYQQLQKEELTKRSRVLKEVQVKVNRVRKTTVPAYSSNLNGPGHANQVIMGDDLNMNACANVADCLRGKVMGVMFDADGSPRSVRSLTSIGGGDREHMKLIVDGVMIDGNHLSELNANDIYSIEVLRSTAYLAMYGSNAPGGALVITMRRGGEARRGQTSFSGVITYAYKGFTPERKFYTPKYSATTPPADRHNTVYWNPDIVTDKDGNATIEYLNNDSKGTYRLVLEGIDSDGNLGRQVYRYKVE